MPKLEVRDGMIVGSAGVDIREELTSVLPDVDYQTVQPNKNMELFWSAESSKLWQIGSQRIAGATGANVGVVSFRIFDKLTEAMGVDVIDIATELADQAIAMGTRSAKNLLRSGLRDGMGVMVGALESAPVVGIIVEMVVALGQSIATVVKLVRAQNRDPTPEYEPAEFSPARDAADAAAVLSATRGAKDWTTLFSPPGWGSGTSYSGAVWTPRLKGGGLAFVTTAPAVGAVGYVPGTTFIHKNIEWHGQKGVFDAGRFYPTPQQHAPWLWSHVGQDDVGMYTVDANALASRWEGYLLALRVAIEEADIPTSAKERIVRDMTQWGSKELRFGWAPYGTTKKDFGLDQKRSVDGHPNIRVGSTPTKNADILRRRQFAFLETPMCAYVDESFGAIKGDSMLRSSWKGARKDLLENPTMRSQVHIFDVPDKAFRDELKKRGGGLPISATPASNNIDPGVFAPVAKPPSMPDMTPDSKATAIVAAAGLVGLLIYLRKR